MATRAQKKFIDNYILLDFKNAATAYQRAYPRASEESARREASRLLTKVDIQALLSSTLADILSREKIPLEKRIFDFWTKRAFYDPAEIVDGKGALIHPLEELSRRGLSVCVEGIETRTNAQGAETTKIKLADRDKALEMLQLYIGMVKPLTQKVEIGGLSDEARARLALLYDEESSTGISPAVIDPQREAPDDD